MTEVRQMTTYEIVSLVIALIELIFIVIDYCKK